MRNFFLSLLMLTLFCACKDTKGPTILLDKIDAMCDSDPKRAIDILDSIPNRLLSEEAYYHHSLLSIKARDKAYVRHTSDSMITDVIDYYTRHKDGPLYPQALYYGARVYSDLGNDDKAMRYFSLALGELSGSGTDEKLKSAVCSQYGRLLHKLRLDTLAISHLQQAIELNRHLRDSANEVHNLHLLGLSFLRLGEGDLAEEAFAEAHKISKCQSPGLLMKSRMYLALAKMRSGDADTALAMARECLAKDGEDKEPSNSVLAIFGQVYYNAGIYDTAFIHAKRLVENEDTVNRMIGLYILTRPELKRFSSADTLDFYMGEFSAMVENDKNGNDRFRTMMQKAHHRDLRSSLGSAETVSLNKTYFVALAILAVSIMIVCAKLLKMSPFGNAADICALENQDYLYKSGDAAESRDPEMCEGTCNTEEEAENESKGCEDADCNSDDSCGSQERRTDESCAESGGGMRGAEKDMRVQDGAEPDRSAELRASTLARVRDLKDGNCGIDRALSESQAYKTLLGIVQSGRRISDDTFWEELEKAITNSSPNFRDNLHLLMDRVLTKEDYQTCMLIKCNLKPSQIRVALDTSSSAITSRRSKYCAWAYSNTIDKATMDTIIRLL